MTSIILEANSFDVLKPVIDFAKSYGVIVKSVKTKSQKLEFEAFRTEAEALNFCNDISMEYLNEAW
jgi:hypothetical protein